MCQPERGHPAYGAQVFQYHCRCVSRNNFHSMQCPVSQSGVAWCICRELLGSVRELADRNREHPGRVRQRPEIVRVLPQFSSRSQLVASLFDTLHATRLSATMPQQPLHLAHELLTLFSKGEVSASTVQSLAHSARCDGWGKHNKLASQLASASTQGKHSGNVNRDIIRAARAAGLLSSSAQPYIIELPDHTTLDIFLPHEAYYKMVEVDGLESFCLAETDTSQPELAALITEWMGHRGGHPRPGQHRCSTWSSLRWRPVHALCPPWWVQVRVRLQHERHLFGQ